jgi:hypothetical protein
MPRRPAGALTEGHVLRLLLRTQGIVRAIRPALAAVLHNR